MRTFVLYSITFSSMPFSNIGSQVQAIHPPLNLHSLSHSYCLKWGYSRLIIDKYLDTTVKPPLALSWSKYTGTLPKNGVILTNYRIYYGIGNRFYGTSNQTGRDYPEGQNYQVGKPFYVNLPSNVTSDATQIYFGTNRNLYFGLGSSVVARLSGYDEPDGQGSQSMRYTSNLGMGAIKAISSARNGSYFVAMSDSRLKVLDTGMGQHGGFSVDSGGVFTGITEISGFAGVGVTSDHGWDKGYLYMYEWVINNPNTSTYTRKLTYYAGLPKYVAYDDPTGYIYAIDKEGRFYKDHYRDTGNATLLTYAGNVSNRGFRSVGGVLLDGGFAYVSTETSFNSSNQEVWQGTITKINTSNGSKSYYIHNSSITTTPIKLGSYIYFGDAYGKVWALDPNSMQLVRNISINNGQYFDYFDVGKRVENIGGADNHLIVSTADTIHAYKGRPDYYVKGQYDGGYNLNGKRYNFYNNTIPTINVTQSIGNAGTFDYNVYDDFGGENSQTTTMELHRTNDWYNVPINAAAITNNVPWNYTSNKNHNDKLRFQVPVNGAFNVYYPFTPPTEGRYRLTTIANNRNYIQGEFNTYGSNSAQAYFDVVDMRNPNTWSSKSSYRPNETVTFGLSKTQVYTYSSYYFEVKNQSGSIVYTSSGTGFPSTLSMSGKTGAIGQYSYQLRIRNSYGDTLYSGWKTFNVVNNGPVAGFTTNKTTYYLDENISVTSTASDPDGDPLTYSYTVTKPDNTTFTKTTANFSFSAVIRGTYTIKQVVTDPYNASATITKTIRVINRPPIAGFSTDKPLYYIGDTMAITSIATDPDGDPLTYSYLVTRPNGTTFTNTNANFSFKTDQFGLYTIKQTVNDGNGGIASVTNVLEVRDLSIIGHVTHTPDWEQKHLAMGHMATQYYSGEKFIVSADVVNQPINYVQVEFKGLQEDGGFLLLTTNLNKRTNILYNGEIFDGRMLEPGTTLKKGNVSFKFTVQYSNGTIRTNIVNVEIIGSVYDALQLHRTY